VSGVSGLSFKGPPVRFFWASLAATVLIALGVLVALYVRMTRVPAGPPGGGVELPSGAIWFVWLADMIFDFWWLLVPLVLIVCFGIAILFGSRGQVAEH
jgi:hypothetical protein